MIKLITGSVIVSAIIAVVMVAVMMNVDKWWLRLIFFIIGLGAANIAMGIISPGPGWTLLINALLFGALGGYSVKRKGVGNRVMGVIFLIVALALIFPAINAFGYQTPKTVWGALVDSVQTGWQIFMDTLQKVFSKT